MQDCFRLHPDIYGSEIDEDEMDEQLDEQRVALESSSPTSEGGDQPASVAKQEAEKEPKNDSPTKTGEENKEAK